MEDVVKQITPLASYLMSMELFPVFFIADFSISSLLVRNDSCHLGPKFRQKHPFTSWLCTVVTALSGAFVGSFFFGTALLDILQENVLLMLLTVVWYLVNYSPFDIVYKVMMLPVFIIPASIMQECVRLHFLYQGVQAAAEIYPRAPLIILMGGIIKGNGYGFIKIVERLVRGIWDPKSNEFLEVTYFTKSSILGSLVFLLHYYKVLNYPVELLYLGVLTAFVFFRLILELSSVDDPLSHIDAHLCRLAFGGWEENNSAKPEPKEKQPKGSGDADNNKNNSHNNNNNSKKKNNNAKKRDNKKKD